MTRTRFVEPVAALGGGFLAAAASLASLVRRPAKPLHPYGQVRSATLTRHGGGDSGVSWLDEAGRDDVLVRRSRAAGLPAWLPDVHGLAIGVPLQGVRGDLLLASTGLGRLTRFTLTVAWRADRRPLTTLLPYRSPSGPLLVAARSDGPDRYRLGWACGTGTWTEWGVLAIHEGSGDSDVVFDPVLRPLPGLVPYAWVERLREPAYRASRSRRDE